MKVSAVIFATALAVASVQGAAMPEANAEPHLVQFCGMRGQPCGKLKRAADAASTILAEVEKREASPSPRWKPHWAVLCGMRGKPCGKAKRAALALEEAINDAYNYDTVPEDYFEERDASPEASSKRGWPKREADPEAEPHLVEFCGMRGQPCGKVRRAVAEIQAVAAEDDGELTARDADPHLVQFCGMRGQPCGKAKRAFDNLVQTAEEALQAISEDTT